MSVERRINNSRSTQTTYEYGTVILWNHNDREKPNYYE